jgi:HSP20 family protein
MIVPGLEPDQLEIEMMENIVTIEGKFPAADDEVNYLRQERPAGKFRRVVKLPKTLDVEAAQADLKLGVLSLQIPVAEEALPRTIQVKAK